MKGQGIDRWSTRGVNIVVALEGVAIGEPTIV